jgi:FixJ family two-component response regulator
MGHTVKMFASAEEFEAETIVVDCAIVDVRLPGLNGIELGQRLRHRTAPVPVVLVTGDGGRLARDFPRPIDTPLLTKPFDDAMLTAAIAEAISTCARHAR